MDFSGRVLSAYERYVNDEVRQSGVDPESKESFPTDQKYCDLTRAAVAAIEACGQDYAALADPTVPGYSDETALLAGLMLAMGNFGVDEECYYFPSASQLSHVCSPQCDSKAVTRLQQQMLSEELPRTCYIPMEEDSDDVSASSISRDEEEFDDSLG